MEWINIDPRNLPEEEVIAKRGTDYLVGYLQPYTLLYRVICVDEPFSDYPKRLEDPTHYIPLSELETLPHELEKD